jgi:hypothetical protein
MTTGETVRAMAARWEAEHPRGVRKVGGVSVADIGAALNENARETRVQRTTRGNDMKERLIWKVLDSTPTPEAVAKAAEMTRDRLKQELKAQIRKELTPEERRQLAARLSREPDVTRLAIAKGADRDLDADLAVAGVREVADDVTRLLVEQRDGSTHRLGGDQVAKAGRTSFENIVGQRAWTGTKYDD